MRLPAALTLQTQSVTQDLRQQRAGTWQVTLPIPTGMYGLLGLNDVQSRILATLQEPDGGTHPVNLTYHARPTDVPTCASASSPIPGWPRHGPAGGNSYRYFGIMLSFVRRRPGRL
jgi:hypothetical protein